MKDRPRAGFVPQMRAICEIGSVWQAGEKNNESEDIADYCFAPSPPPSIKCCQSPAETNIRL